MLAGLHTYQGNSLVACRALVHTNDNLQLKSMAHNPNSERHIMLRNLIVASALLILNAGTPATAQTAAASPAQNQAAPQAATRNDYSNGDNWLCRPGRQDACAVDLSTTVITADGKLKTEKWAANSAATIDCFYVYPTVSNEPTGNSSMVPHTEEKAVVKAQFARFGSKCRVYAPMYRQITLTALRAMLAGQPLQADRGMAYNDVLDAWNYYLEHDNKGRGVVLIGHSQGSGVLTQLIKNEIDGKPVQERIVSALLLGTSLPVPKGKDVGGAFQHMPLCHAADEIGCVITYASFRANVPPPANSRFGKVAGENMQSACTNPAALGGGSGELHAYLGSGGSGISTINELPPGPWVKPPQPITTPFVSVPGMLTAECVVNEHGSYLAVTVHGDPAGPRTSDIVGDVVVSKQVLPDWGLHLIDVNLTMGNLLDIVDRETKAYHSASAKK
jgi:Protein of unknown function (DUF3089)